MNDMRIILLLSLITTSLVGCMTPAKTVLRGPEESFPDEAFIVQRGILTARGKQYTLNGYLARSKSRGMRLVVTENFGNPLMDILIEPDGYTHVMRSGGVFRDQWLREYVAADVQCIFGSDADAACPGTQLGPDRFLIQRRWYRLELQVVEVRPGEQSADMFHPPAAP